MTFQDKVLKELTSVLMEKQHARNPKFYELKREITAKLGKVKWEKLLNKAKMEAVREINHKTTL